MERNEATYQNEAFDAISILTKKHFEVMQNIKYVKNSLLFGAKIFHKMKIYRNKIYFDIYSSENDIFNKN